MADSKGTKTTDMRLRDGVEDHIKVQKLVARFGLAGWGALIVLWRYTKEHAPADGILSMTADDLAIVSRISREAPQRAEEFGRCLIDLRLVDDLGDGRLAVHDWTEEQPHIVEAAMGYPSARANGSKGGKESVKTRREKYGDAQPRSKLEPPLRERRTPPSELSKQTRTPPSEAPKPMPSMPSSHALPKAKAGEEEGNAFDLQASADAPPSVEAGREQPRSIPKQTWADVERIRKMNPPRRPPA